MMIVSLLVGFLVCPHQLGAEGAAELWKLALQDGYVLTIIRDEYILIHSVFEKQLQDLKTKELVYNKCFAKNFIFNTLLEIVNVQMKLKIS